MADDVVNFGKELNVVFQGEASEKELIESIHCNLIEIRKLQATQRDRLKQTIQNLINMEGSEIEKVEADDEKTVQISKVNEMAAKIQSEKEHLEEVTRTCTELKQSLQSNIEIQESLARETQKTKHDASHTLVKLRYEVDLYTQMTNIRWQQDSEPDTIKGYICNKNDIKPFSLNEKQVSKFFITNYLWDLMEEE